MRTLWRVVLPLAAGVLVLAAATLVPVTHVHGTHATGPIRAYVPPPWPRGAVRVTWADDHRRVALHVRAGRMCPPAVLGETSTAPARIEVRLRLLESAACRADPTTTRLLVATPSVAEPGQALMVLVDGKEFDLAGYPR